MPDYRTHTVYDAGLYEDRYHAEPDWEEVAIEADAREDAKESKRRSEAAGRVIAQARRDELQKRMAELDAQQSFAAFLEGM